MDVEELHSTELILNFNGDFDDDGVDNNDTIYTNDYDDISIFISSDSACNSPDIEILPVNNNNSDNNLNSVRNLVLHGNNNNNACNEKIQEEKIQEEALQICNLLPNFKYKWVYNVLSKNRKAKNRVMLSLWDLLPNKRPRIQYEDWPVQLNPLQKNNQQFNSNTLINNNTVSNDRSNSKITQDRKNAVSQTSDENEVLDHSTNDGKVSSTAKGTLLRPAKLLIDHQPQGTKPSSVVLHPPKLTNVAAKQQRSEKSALLLKNNNGLKEQTLSNYMQYLKYMQTIKQKKLNQGLQHFNFDSRNKARRMFLTSECTSSVETEASEMFEGTKKKKMKIQTNFQNNKNAVKNDIVLPLQSQQTYKTLALMFPQVDQHYIRQICKNLSNLENTHKTELQWLVTHTLSAIVDFARLFTSLKGLNSAKITTMPPDADAASTSSNAQSTRALNLNDSLTTVLSRPSTSTAIHVMADKDEAFGGAKKKKIIRKESSKSSKAVNKKDIVLPLKFQEMYEALIYLYPGIDKSFIKETCKKVSKLQDICPFDQLEILAEHALQNKEIQLTNTDNVLLANDDNEQYTFLSGIFPDADPAFLKKVIARTHSNPTEIINFIQTQWEHPTFPTKEEKLKQMKITEQQMQYIDKFNVETFLRTFPDPFAYFTDPKRNGKFSPDAMDFLKYHFSQFEEDQLKHLYNVNNYNLTLTVQKLENLPFGKKVTRNVQTWNNHPPEDISVLRECAFIIHREEITEHLNKLKEAEVKEFEELKRKNLLLECQCCYDECIPSKCSTCNDGHVFCNSCIVKGTVSQLAQGNARISCFSECSGEFTVPTLQKILPPTQFSIYIHKKQEVEVMAAEVEGLVACPFCHFASIPPPEDKVFKCFNPECMKESCRLCKEPNHIPRRCYEERTDKVRLLIEEKMTEALVRKCYKCSRPYYKQDGCNKITCPCGAKMCYICDTPILDYSHFDVRKCPLMSDNYSINDGTVRAVAEKMVTQAKKEDPNVQVKVDDFLNYLSRTANAIPERVSKITNHNK